MSDESENVSLQFLGKQMERMFSELAEIKRNTALLNERFDKTDEKLGRLGSDVEEVGLAVASLSVSNRHIRADVSKILANQEQHDARIKRIEQHLGLTDA
jgi:uncharacterized protein YoxC